MVRDRRMELCDGAEDVHGRIRKETGVGRVLGSVEVPSEVYEDRGRRNLMARGQWSPYPLSWSQCHESWTWIGLSDE